MNYYLKYIVGYHLLSLPVLIFEILPIGMKLLKDIKDKIVNADVT